jgi:hypothetical protein
MCGALLSAGLLIVAREHGLGRQLVRDQLRDELEQRVFEATGERPDQHATTQRPGASRTGGAVQRLDLRRTV